MAKQSSRKVAIVTGASRGIGRGVALGLGEAGWTVYVTGRTLDVGESERPGRLLATAREIDEIGGAGIAARCDHRVAADSAALSALVDLAGGGEQPSRSLALAD